MARTKQAKPEQEQEQQRDLSKRPSLNKDAKERFEKMKKAAKNRVFFKFAEGDDACVQILSRDTIPTENGPSPRYKAFYQSGNIHGTGAGAPEKEGDTFFFWSSTMLESLIEENDVRNGDSIAISGLGMREGRNQTYYDYALEVFDRAPNAQSLIPAGTKPVAELQPGNTS